MRSWIVSNILARRGAVRRRMSLCLVLLMILPCPRLAADNLSLSLEGLDGELRENALAWLGNMPSTPAERLNFLVSARQRVSSSLRALGYYRPDIETTVQRTEPLWQIRIAVTPGEPVTVRSIDVKVTGAAAGDPEFAQLTAEPGIYPGDVLHHGRDSALTQQLQTLGRTRGYFDAQFDTAQVTVASAAGSADIVLHYNSGLRYRFGALKLDETLAEQSLLQSLQTFEEGDFFERERLQKFQAELQSTGFFMVVTVEPEIENRQAESVPVAVELLAARRHNFDAGIGYSTDTKERVSLSWRTPRINRFGHSQVTRLEYSTTNPSGRFTYSIPLSHPLNDILQLWARTENNDFGDIDSRQDEVGLRREIRRGSWTYGYSLRDLNESWDVQDLASTNDYLLLGASLSSRMVRGPIIDPELGFSQLYTIEAGNQEIGSDVDLIRFTANLRQVYSPWTRHRLVARADFGIADIASGDRTELAPSLNFFAGGDHSIRGFAYQSLGNEITTTGKEGKLNTQVVGGDRLVVGSMEYQYYLTDKWRGAVFYDWGDAFDDGEFDANYGAGFGLHYISPVGAVRVELANSLSEDNPDWRIHLSVGAEF
jgi:translocation and assembly module TamA